MSLQEKLKKDLMAAMKAKDDTLKGAIRIIIGELSRERSKEIEDARVIKIIKGLIKSEEEGHKDQVFIGICKAYLPVELDESVIESWIKENIDFSVFKNKMQAMKPIMAHFGNQVDGNVVKGIIGRM